MECVTIQSDRLAFFSRLVLLAIYGMHTVSMCVRARVCVYTKRRIVYEATVSVSNDEPTNRMIFCIELVACIARIVHANSSKLACRHWTPILLFALAIRDFSLENLFESHTKPSQLLSFIHFNLILKLNHYVKHLKETPKDWYFYQYNLLS